MAAPNTRLLCSKKEAGSFGASCVRVKKEPGVTPNPFARVKKEHGAPVPPSMKKALRLPKDAARQLDYQGSDYLEEFPSPRAVERASFNEI
jgi:hypothetical protein